MKVLLLGEFSALHVNLKDALQELGHEAVVVGYSGGFKKIAVDICLDIKLPSFLGSIEGRVKPLMLLPSLRNYDVVQLMSPLIFRFGRVLPFPARFFHNYIINNNKRFFMLGAGDDCFYWRHARFKMEYGPFEDFLKYDLKSESCEMQDDSLYEYNKYIADKCDGIIPVMYDYEIGYAEHPRVRRTIPLPMNLSKIKHVDNRPGSKLIVFHGLNRYGFKGTRHVEKAFEYLNKKYPNDLELIIKGHMPIGDYLDLMSRVNVVIDQLNTYSLGMNGIYALAMGKVVLGGGRHESLASLGVGSSPIIDIRPNHESIIEAVEMLLENRSRIPEMGYESRLFAEEVHDHIRVAQMYLKEWAD